MRDENLNETNTSAPHRKSRLWVMRFLGLILPLLVIVMAVGAFIVMSALKPEPEKKQEAIKPQPVLTTQVTREAVTLEVTAQGEVQPRTQINIVPQVNGRILFMSPKFIEGGHFKKGDLLIRIEAEDFKLALVQAQANIAQAQTALEREQSESDLARNDWEDLGQSGTPSRLTLREPQMAEAKARLEAARAQQAEAELKLSRTSIYAPFTGRVLERRVNQGEYVSTGMALGEVYASDIMDVRLPMTNSDLARIGLSIGFEANAKIPGVPVVLSASVAGKEARWSASIVRTDNRFDAQTRVLYAYAEVRDPFGKAALDGTPLAPGLYVTANITGKTQDQALVIPRNALRGTDKVYVVGDDDKLSIRTVSVLATDRHKAVLSSGLSEGERVVTSPIRTPIEGMSIHVVERLNADDVQAHEGSNTHEDPETHKNSETKDQNNDPDKTVP